jgi:EpsI family protein
MISSVIMTSAATAAHVLTPTVKLAEKYGRLDLETAIPIEFNGWRMDQRGQASIINPQTEQLLKATYSQTLSRTYQDNTGNRMMLSIAYGEDQTNSGSEIHHPEICYPAQGFEIRSQRPDQVATSYGRIPVKRLETYMGTQRVEPVTYWITIGDKIALTGFDKKIVEISHGMRGEIIDGLLFRVSNISTSSAAAYEHQDEFINDLLKSTSENIRQRLIGRL